MNEMNSMGSLSPALKLNPLQEELSPQWRPARPLEGLKHLPTETGEVFFIEIGEFVARWWPAKSGSR